MEDLGIYSILVVFKLGLLTPLPPLTSTHYPTRSTYSFILLLKLLTFLTLTVLISFTLDTLLILIIVSMNYTLALFKLPFS